MKNKEQQEHFLKTGHLINKKIQCNKCESEITMFGSNLENRIKKFGTLWSLLDEFKCRECVSAAKPKKEKNVSVRFMKRVKKNDARRNMIMTIPKLKPYVSREIVMKYASEGAIAELTGNGTCLRPDVFLDYGCDNCPYVKNCNATCKTLKHV